jgi:hypothetical protein
VAGTLLCFVGLSALTLPPPPAQADAPAETVIRLNVHPAPAPKPALRYLLLPELREMTSGNPIPNYLKCLLDQDFTSDQETIGRAGLRQADRAARMDKPDWQILPKLRTDGIGLLLPDVQKLRALAQSLQGRFRDEVALRRFDDALVTARTMFAMSRHMGEHPTLIGDLVGFAIAFVAISPLEQMLEQPGCPNLYWALTNLPSPLISMEKGMEGERMFVDAELRDLDPKAPMSPDQLKKVIAHIDKILSLGPGTKRMKTRDWLDARNKDEKYLSAARARLVEYGLVEKQVSKFPPDQVLLLDQKREYEVERDEAIKLATLPTWEAVTLLSKIKPSKEPEVLFAGFVPALDKVRNAQGRLEQRIGLLRHVEALRLYAAAHDGKLPAKLSEVGVPLPLDPFTGKPFRYSLEGETAHVWGTPPPRYENNAAFNIHYEITIHK